MSKKNKSIYLLKELDRGMNGTYETIEEEIEAYRQQILMADKIAERKIRRKMRKNPGAVYTTREQRDIRNQILIRMEKSSFIDRCEENLKAIIPTIIMLARMIAGFIVLLLQIKPVQAFAIDHGLMPRINGLYKLAMGVNV